MPKGTQTAGNLKRLRKATLEEITALQAQLQAEIEPASAPDDDSVDVAEDIYERGKILSLIQSLEEKLHNIEHAITVASNGSYGICENCGNPIPPERLEILPETTLCVSCANKLEQGIRRRRIQMADEQPLEQEHNIDDEYEGEEEEEFEEESDDEL